MTRLQAATLLGSITGIVTVLSFIPQVVHVWKTKRTSDLAASTFVLLVVQSAGWTTYGVLLQQAPIIWTNSGVLLLTMLILAAKFRYG